MLFVGVSLNIAAVYVQLTDIALTMSVCVCVCVEENAQAKKPGERQSLYVPVRHNVRVCVATRRRLCTMITERRVV